MRFKLDPFSPTGVSVVDDRPTQVVRQSNGYLGESGVQTLVAGSNVSIDQSDPKHPIISTTVPNITVSDTAPSSPALNDLWVDTT